MCRQQWGEGGRGRPRRDFQAAAGTEVTLDTTGSSSRVLSRESRDELWVLKRPFDCCVENGLKGQREVRLAQWDAVEVLMMAWTRVVAAGVEAGGMASACCPPRLSAEHVLGNCLGELSGPPLHPPFSAPSPSSSSLLSSTPAHHLPGLLQAV